MLSLGSARRRGNEEELNARAKLHSSVDSSSFLPPGNSLSGVPQLQSLAPTEQETGSREDGCEHLEVDQSGDDPAVKAQATRLRQDAVDVGDVVLGGQV